MGVPFVQGVDGIPAAPNSLIKAAAAAIVVYVAPYVLVGTTTPRVPPP